MRNHEPDSPERLLAVQEVARLLAVSQWTVYRMLQRGELRSVRVRSRRLVRQADVDAFVRGQLHGA